LYCDINSDKLSDCERIDDINSGWDWLIGWERDLFLISIGLLVESELSFIISSLYFLVF